MERQRGSHDAQTGAGRDSGSAVGVARRTPETSTAQARLLHLQRTAGNAAVSAALAANRDRPPVVQRSAMRDGSRGVATHPGKAVPSFDALVLARLEAIVQDAKIEPNDLLDAAIAAFRAAEPDQDLPGPVMDHPLEQWTPLTSWRERVVTAIHAQAGVKSTSRVNDFVLEVAGQLTATLPKEADFVAKFDQFRQQTEAVFHPYVAAAELQLYTDAGKMPDAELRNLVAAAANANPGTAADLLNLAAALHISREERPARAALTAEQNGAMVAALEAMDVVQRMYRGTLRESGDHGLHMRNLDIPKDVENQKHFNEYSANFIKRVGEGLLQYGALVEPVSRPPDRRVTSIKVEKDPVIMRKYFLSMIEEPKAFRADADRTGNQVRLSIMTDVPTIVHEFGHQVEFNLPLRLWLDLHQILRDRTQERRLKRIFPDNDKEAGIVADLPGFRADSNPHSERYAGKVYASGDTELMSMTMQMFSDPGTARAFIQSDPQLAATVLRAIRPAEFDANAAFTDELKRLLPRGR